MPAEALKCLLENRQALTQFGQNSRAPVFTLPACILSCHWINRVKKTTKKTKREKLHLPKTLLQKEGGLELRPPRQARVGNDKSEPVITGDEKQQLSDEERQQLPFAPVRKGMRRDHKHNYPHARFSVCQNWLAFKDLGVLILWHPESPQAGQGAASRESLPQPNRLLIWFSFFLKG